MLSAMSPDLRGRVMNHTYSQWLYNIPFFRLRLIGLSETEVYDAKGEHAAFMLALTPRITSVVFAPLEAMIRPNNVVSFMYGIASASVCVL